MGVALRRIVKCIDDMMLNDAKLLTTARYNPKCTGQGTNSSTVKDDQHNRRHIIFYFESREERTRAICFIISFLHLISTLLIA